MGQFGLLRFHGLFLEGLLKSKKKSNRHMEIFRNPFTEKGENYCSGLTSCRKDLFMLSRTEDLQ